MPDHDHDRDQHIADDFSGPGYFALPVGSHADLITSLMNSLLGDRMAVLDVPAMSLAGSETVFMLCEMGEETDTDFEYKHVPVVVQDPDTGEHLPLMVVGMEPALLMLSLYRDQLTNPQGYLLMGLQPKFAMLRPLDALDQLMTKARQMAARAGNGEPEEL